MSEDIKIQVLFDVHNEDFTTSIKEHYTTVEHLMQGVDPFDYISGPKVIAIRQYTGREDSVGNELYVGDICYVEGQGNCTVFICHNYGVSFDDGNANYVPLIDCDAEQDLYSLIGNVHQHPELLK